jgi:hypothetical protein
MVKRFLQTFKGKYFFGIGEDRVLKEILESCSVERITAAFSGYDLVVFDEAQKISEVGTALKILTDTLPTVKIIATGSSSFDLSNKVGEPLTGRRKVITLFPLSALELKESAGPMGLLERMESYLLYGSYPEVLNIDNSLEKREYLAGLRDSYLLKDILELENIKGSDKLFSLLKLLAFQIGKEVSLNELGNALGMAKQTAERYLDLLEKTFIIKRVLGFSRNLRKEITKTARYYFIDTGVRNAVINNFNSLEFRDDRGALWENYLFCERLKRNAYLRTQTDMYFWRTYDRQEIDIVEEKDGVLHGYECKWSPGKKRIPPAWRQAYPEAGYTVVTRENFLDFVV